MPSSSARKCRRNFAFLIVGAAAVLAAAAFALPRPSALAANRSVDATLPVLAAERDGLRYEYHLPTGREALFDVKNDPRELVNVLHDHEALAGALRAELAARHGVADLADLRAPYDESVRRLRSLGYF